MPDLQAASLTLSASNIQIVRYMATVLKVLCNINNADAIKCI